MNDFMEFKHLSIIHELETFNLSVNICCSLKLHEQFMEFKFLSVQTPTRMMEFKLSQSNYESLLRLSMIHGAKPLSVQT